MGNRLTGLLMVLLVVLGAGLAAELFLGGGDAEPPASGFGRRCFAGAPGNR